ncbi:MAG: EAL domain-containing protein [Thermodesulfobacteriota bacterium]
MKQEYKTDRQHIKELEQMRQQIAELEAAGAERKRTEEKLRIVITIMEAVHKLSDLKQIFNTAIDKVMELTDIDIVGIYLVDKDTNEAVLEAHRGYQDKYIEVAKRIPYPNGVIWRVIESGEIYVVQDVSTDPNIGSAAKEVGFQSFMSVPLKIEDVKLGAIHFHSYKKNKFGEQEIKLFSSVGNQIAIAIAKGKQTEELNRRNKDLRTINAISQAVNRPIDLEEVYKIALDMVIEQEYVDIACIYLVDDVHDEAVLQDHRNLTEGFLKRASRIPYPRGATWRVINTGEILNVKNAREDPDVGPAGRDLGFRSMLGIPIRLEEKAIGVIWLLSFKEHLFTKQVQDFFTSIGNHIAISITKANLYRELSKKNRYETISNTVTQSVHKSINIIDVLENAVESMHLNIYGTENISIYFVEGSDAVIKAYRGYPDWFIKRVGRIPYPKGFTWKAIIEGKPRYVADVDMDDVIGPAGREVGTKSYLSMPIRLEDSVVGVININSLRKHAFSEHEIELLENVAHQIEVAIKNARQAETLRQSEERYRTLFDQSPVGVYIFNEEFRVTNCNSRFVEILNTSYDKVIGVDLRKWKDKHLLPLMEKVLQGQSTVYEGYYEATSNSSKLFVNIKLSPLRDDQGNVIGGMAVMEDITDRKQMEQALKESEERLAAIFSNTPNVAIGGYDSDGRVLYWNNAAEGIFGWTSEESIGKTLDQLILDKESTLKFSSILKEVARTYKPYGPSEWKFFGPEGKEGVVYSSIFPIPPSNGKKEFIRMDIDITERKYQEEKIRYMAMHDSLTDLPNRRALQEKLDQIMKLISFKVTHALVVMDLDNFKLINDTLGHLEGDQLLIDLANVLNETKASKDQLARVGGDEFAMVLNDVTVEKAKVIAERFSKAINDYRINLNGHSFQLGMSIGITMIDSKSDPQMTMGMAYSALATAKYEGKNRITVYQHENGNDFDHDKTTRWIFRINDALRENRFILHFQSVIRLDSGEIEYIEALLRMQDSSEGIIFPKSFLPAAERLGLISEIDRWVLQEAVRILRRNTGNTIFVNLSGSSLRDASLLEFIEEFVSANKDVSKNLGFEITEFTKIIDLVRVRTWIEKLKDLGCRFALDDFGIGYSSFTHLLSLLLDYVKIEASFVKSLSIDPTSIAIVKAIITVSHSMGKEVIAEGVEDESVVDFLRKLKVKFGQGTLWKTPSSDIC